MTIGTVRAGVLRAFALLFERAGRGCWRRSQPSDLDPGVSWRSSDEAHARPSNGPMSLRNKLTMHHLRRDYSLSFHFPGMLSVALQIWHVN
jgi:hypothetical protein